MLKLAGKARFILNETIVPATIVFATALVEQEIKEVLLATETSSVTALDPAIAERSTCSM